jgi:hypothetical protein
MDSLEKQILRDLKIIEQEVPIEGGPTVWYDWTPDLPNDGEKISFIAWWNRKATNARESFYVSRDIETVPTHQSEASGGYRKNPNLVLDAPVIEVDRKTFQHLLTLEDFPIDFRPKSGVFVVRSAENMLAIDTQGYNYPRYKSSVIPVELVKLAQNRRKNRRSYGKF